MPPNSATNTSSSDGSIRSTRRSSIPSERSAAITSGARSTASSTIAWSRAPCGATSRTPGSASASARALRPGGAIALFWNHHVQSDADAGFFDAVKVVYEREAPEKAKKWERLTSAEELGEPELPAIERSGLFGPVAVRKYRWDQSYDAAGYVDVLNTYSDHLAQPAEERERLFRGIAEFIDTQYGGRVAKGYQTILYVARRI